MISKLKIGVVVDQLLAGGVQLSAIEQVKHLNLLGHDSKLLILMRKHYSTDFSYLVKNIPYQYLSDSYPPLFRTTLKLPFFSFLSTSHLLSPFLAPQVIKSDNYDVLISLGTTTCLTSQAIYRKLGLPYVAVIHDPIVYILDKCYTATPLHYFFFVLKPLARYFESVFVSNAKSTIVISPLHQKYLQDQYDVQAKLLGFGVYSQPHITRKRSIRILSFGRWEKSKNPSLLLDIAASLPKIRLTIAGTWTSSQDLVWFQQEITTRRLGKRVTLVTHYSDSQSGLKKMCDQSLVWIYPNFEAYSLAALEATSHGLPIIIPKGSGVTTGFTHGKEGFFPPSASIQTYLPYITKLLANPQLAQRMGYQAWKTSRDKYSWSAQTQQLEHIITASLHTKPEIVVVELGHATGATLAGGDKLMEPMLASLKKAYCFHILASALGRDHWITNPIAKRLTTLPRNVWDNFGQPVPVFITYLIRIVQSCFSMLIHPSPAIIYSSTNVFPDVIVSFIFKFFWPKAKWVARIHHLVPLPHQRPGKLLVNIVSYLLQALALILIKILADTIITLNQPLVHDLERLGFAKSKIKILGAGIFAAKIASAKTSRLTNQYDAIFVGRLHSSKGIFDLFPIWQRVLIRLPQARLAIVGPGFEYLHLNSVHIPPNIDFLGQVSDTKKFALLKNSRLFLFTDHEAGWGIAAAEAMAAKLPVIGYDIGILGSVYQSGFLTVPPYNTDQFADQIVKLLTRPKLHSQISQAAFHQAFKLDWSITAEKFKMILDETLAAPHRP